jgi:hypothetical protein
MVPYVDIEPKIQFINNLRTLTTGHTQLPCRGVAKVGSLC